MLLAEQVGLVKIHWILLHHRHLERQKDDLDFLAVEPVGYDLEVHLQEMQKETLVFVLRGRGVGELEFGFADAVAVCAVVDVRLDQSQKQK